MDSLRTLFQDYIAYAGQLREETASVKSVLGLRDREIYDSGHKTFDRGVADWVSAFAKTSPSQEDLLEALDILLFSALGYEGRSPYWYLCAVQRHAVLLIPLLNEDSKAKLLERFEARYPKGQRLPIQNDIFNQLSGGRKKWCLFSRR